MTHCRCKIIFSVELRCSDKYLEKYSYLEWANEVRIIRPNLESEEPGPIVGNGRIMVQIGHESDEIKIIDQDKTVDLGLDFLYRLVFIFKIRFYESIQTGKWPLRFDIGL